MGKSLLKIIVITCACVFVICASISLIDHRRKVTEDSTQEVKEFTAFFAVPGYEIDEDNDIQDIISQETGCVVKEKWLEGMSVDEAVSDMIESGEYPDFIDGGDNSVRLYEAGALVALDDYIDDYANIRDFFTDEEWDSLRQSDGHIYWIPQFSNIHGQERVCVHSGEAFWIQTRVIEWADYPEIKTMDEYFDLIESYYAANPVMEDGQPVIPYTILCDDWRYFCLENAPEFLDGYPNDGSVIVDAAQRKVVDYNTTDTAVRYFKKLNEEYKKGIVDPDSFVQSYDEYIEKLSSGRVLGMIDQWWDFADMAEDAIKAGGLDELGCQYVPLPITIDEEITNQWHNSGEAMHTSSGLAITSSCEDVEGALGFVNDLLEQDVHNLRFWGVEGIDYEVDNNGMFYRTPEMRKNVVESGYKKSHLCDYSYFPQWAGTSVDGKNAMQPAGQETEFYDGLSDCLKRCFDAYGAKTYVEMLGTHPAPGPWYPMYTYSQTMTDATPGGRAWELMESCKHQYLPRVVMADNFELAWQQYMEAYESCRPEDFLSEMQQELERRIAAAEGGF